MTNPMMKQLARSNPNLTGIKNLYNIICNSGNPQMMLNQMMSQNPQIKQAMDYINSSGGDAKTAFYKMAKEKGVDPESILSQLR